MLCDNTINKKTLELFQSDDFITLFGIYLKNPTVFQELYKYTCKTDFVPDEKNELFEITEDNSYYYKKLLKILTVNNICSDEDKILEVYKKYGGNLNLVLRYFISNQ